MLTKGGDHRSEDDIGAPEVGLGPRCDREARNATDHRESPRAHAPAQITNSWRNSEVASGVQRVYRGRMEPLISFHVLPEPKLGQLRITIWDRGYVS